MSFMEHHFPSADVKSTSTQLGLSNPYKKRDVQTANLPILSLLHQPKLQQNFSKASNPCSKPIIPKVTNNYLLHSLNPHSVPNHLKMKPKNSLSFKCKKLSHPCRKVLRLLKFRFKKPLFIRPLWGRTSRHRPEPRKTTRKLTGLLSLFGSLRRSSREMDTLTELKSFSDAGTQRAPFPSPITPVYVKMNGGAAHKKEVLVQEDVEDACRSFENYLVEMIVEEGKVSDLSDVEELLYCWKNLKCPVFVDLVCRFYGELCKDLFSNTEENIKTT